MSEGNEIGRRWALIVWPKYQDDDYLLLPGRYETREGAKIASDVASEIHNRTVMVVRETSD